MTMVFRLWTTKGLLRFNNPREVVEHVVSVFDIPPDVQSQLYEALQEGKDVLMEMQPDNINIVAGFEV